MDQHSGGFYADDQKEQYFNLNYQFVTIKGRNLNVDLDWQVSK